MFRRAPSGLDASAQEAIRAVLSDPTFELIPLSNVEDQARFLPAGATVSITCSPTKGVEPTLELTERLCARGLRVVPHLAARTIRDRAHLRRVLDRLADLGVGRAFVVGGDGEPVGDFPDGLSLLRAMADLGHPFAEIGIPCYPQGHPRIPTERLLEALAAKAPYAAYMTTQLCFDPPAIASFIADRRAEGIGLPVHVGLPGVSEIHKLIRISARIGVTDTRRFLAKNTSLIGHLLRPGGFRPDGLLEALAPAFADPHLGVRAVHLYTFNDVETTEAWRRQYLARRIVVAPDGRR